MILDCGGVEGVLTFEMLTGELPFREENEGDTVEDVS